MKTAARPAMEGQVAVEVACNCEQATLVIEHAVAEWSCGKCRCKARPTGRKIILGRAGVLPARWRDDVVLVEAVA